MPPKKICLILAFLVFLLLLPLCSLADPAEDLTAECSISAVDNKYAVGDMTDGEYLTSWESSSQKNPWVRIRSEKPVYGLYLCFRKMPSAYAIQTKTDDQWITVAEESSPMFHHVFYELDGWTEFRILSTVEEETVMSFNEIYAFGEGEIPDWVQRWEPPAEKADLLILVAHPDDEILFFGGTIPTYAAERGKTVEVAYITYSTDTRRSEALNGLWTMGVRNYPEFGPFTDRYPASGELSDAYLYAGGQDVVLEWVTGLFRKYKPDVVVTHADTGEYGHPQHKMAANACKWCYNLAASASYDLNSAQQYGTWQVKKLYLHLYGDQKTQTVFDWDQPLAAFNGKTGAEVAADAFALHVTQKGAGIRSPYGYLVFSVEIFGAYYFPYDHFGLYKSTVGPDKAKNDFFEHLE